MESQWFALYQPNYGRKIVLIMRQTFVYKKTRLLYCAWNGYIFLPELFIKCAIADQRLHAVTIEFKKNGESRNARKMQIIQILS